MAITQIGGTTSVGQQDGNTTIVMTKPVGVAEGDVLTAGITSNNTAHVAPAGWVNFGGIISTTSGVNWQTQLYYKVAGASEPASYSWTIGDVGPSGGFLNAWRGVDTTTPVVGFAQLETDATLGEPHTGPSTTSIAAPGLGRMFYVRSARDAPGGGAATLPNFTTVASGVSRRTSIGGVTNSGNTTYAISQFSDDADFSASGVHSGIGITCSVSEDQNYEATYALKMLGQPSSGSWASTLSPVSASFAGTRTVPTGTVSVQLPALSPNFVGQAAPPSGTVDTVLPLLSTSISGNTTGGRFAADLPSVTTQIGGGVEPIGTLASHLGSVTVEFVGETRPFGGRVIKVANEKRAFRVTEDGMTAIYPSQVAQE